ncbi:MAG TPA: hypothetical protein VH165_10620 [Kofleriaceae bacterium]|nr:hypothetical protein [Kofleriaceae bacterium]
MAPKSIEDAIQRMRSGSSIIFNELAHVCEHYFGPPRISGSHHIYKTPWPGDPRVNIQRDKGNAKTYQIRQVLQAIEKLALEALARAKVAEKAMEKKPKKK